MGTDGDRVEPAVTLTDPVLGGRSASQLHASSDGVVALQLSGFVMFIDDAGGRVLGPGPAPLAGEPQYPLSLIGDDVFWSSWGNRVRVAHASRDQETELFLEASDGGDIHYFQADGTDMAWYAGYLQSEETRQYARVELWTAPYTNDPAALQPRLVAAMPYGVEDALLGGGRWVYVRPTGEDIFANELWVYDLADGRRRHLIFPEGHQLILVHVSADEIIVMGKRPERPGGTNRLFRIRIDTLPVEPE